ncbi:hypothetical protein [Streptomyces sp. NPDC048172]|uniref:hypothetical protein n=1 Tax=Streptomyces sp. NPDC048172 TaxID=3365505 RepID=UPI00371974BA
MRTVHRRSALVAGALVLVAAAAGGASASASEGHGGGGKDEARLVGAAKLFREDGQRVRFSFDARGFGWNELPDGKGTSRGTFRFSHYTPDGKDGAFAEGRIDCLETGGPVATATGVITRTDLKGAKGKRVGFTVYDNGRHDRVGYSWGGGDGDLRTMEVEPCLSAAPYETVEKGDFTVHHKMPF